MSERPADLPFSEFDLTESRYQELTRAFGGAYSILFLLVLLAMTFGFYLPIADKVESWLLSIGLFAMCLLTGFLVMLFVSGVLRMMLAVVFKRIVPDYVKVIRYDRARRVR